MCVSWFSIVGNDNKRPKGHTGVGVFWGPSVEHVIIWVCMSVHDCVNVCVRVRVCVCGCVSFLVVCVCCVVCGCGGVCLCGCVCVCVCVFVSSPLRHTLNYS